MARISVSARWVPTVSNWPGRVITRRLLPDSWGHRAGTGARFDHDAGELVFGEILFMQPGPRDGCCSNILCCLIYAHDGPCRVPHPVCL